MNLSDIVRHHQKNQEHVRAAEEEMRTRAELQFQDMEVQYGKYLRDHPNAHMTFKEFVPKVYCAIGSHHPERFDQWYRTTYKKNQ